MMKVSEIEKKLSLKRASGFEADDREVRGCHIGDLLSLVMSRANKDDAWITVQGNVNVPAVASLTDCSMVIIAEGMSLDKSAQQRADSEGIHIFTSEKSAFELSLEIKECL